MKAKWICLLLVKMAFAVFPRPNLEYDFSITAGFDGQEAQRGGGTRDFQRSWFSVNDPNLGVQQFGLVRANEPDFRVEEFQQGAGVGDRIYPY